MFKNVDAPKRPDTKKRADKTDAVAIPKSGPNRNPKLTKKKSAKSENPGSMRESGAISRTSFIARTGKSGGR
jgi:hypothetical protein